MGTRAMKIVLTASQWWAAASKNSSDWTSVSPGCALWVGRGAGGRKWAQDGMCFSSCASQLMASP